MVKKAVRSVGKKLKKIKDIPKVLQEGKIVCLTGAGISLESGIPVFRGKGGFWETYDPDIYANLPGLVSVFHAHPEKLVEFIIDFYTVLLKAKPNSAHLSLTYLEKSSLLRGVITQNVDKLHQQAGTRSVVELHGNAYRIRCQGCGAIFNLEKLRIEEMLNLLGKAQDLRMKVLRILSRYFPRCVKCGGRFRIDIVLFGELLDEEKLKFARELLNDCRTLLVVGCSLRVNPAATLPLYAKDRGATIIEINQEQSVSSDICDYSLIGQAAEVLPGLIKIME